MYQKQAILKIGSPITQHLPTTHPSHPKKHYQGFGFVLSGGGVCLLLLPPSRASVYGGVWNNLVNWEWDVFISTATALSEMFPTAITSFHSPQRKVGKGGAEKKGLTSHFDCQSHLPRIFQSAEAAVWNGWAVAVF